MANFRIARPSSTRPHALCAATLLAGALWLAFPSSGALAQSGDGPSRYEQLWSHAQLYAGEADAFLNSVQLSGRFQVDQAYVDAGSEEHSETNLRRFRFGVKVEFLDDFLFHAEAEYDPQDGDPVYRRLTDTYIAWSPSDAVAVTVGKHSAPFTLDGMTSSKELMTIDRSNLTNNIWFTEEYVPGVSVEGSLDKLSYHVGFYSSGDINRGFGDSNGGEFWLGTIGYDFAAALGAEQAALNLNLVDNEPDVDNGFTRPLERIASLNFSMERGRWGLGADLSAAQGYLGQSDLLGIMVMPYYRIRNNTELVMRYTYVDSDDVNGVRFGRYESELQGGRGDRYRGIYLGMNHYWYGHKLKLQTGLQYADMADRAADGGAYNGWGWTTGFRISW